MNNSLIGFSGFVGSTLLRQTHFDSLYRSTTIDEIRGKNFDTVVCAAAPAQKWFANQNPDADKEKITGLITHLQTIQCKNFILISTVDVFKNPLQVDEDTPIETSGLHPYGLHRYHLEQFVTDYFPNHLIIRLPGLVGPGLRKNAIFDFLHNNLNAHDSRNVFQFYPMINLWFDIQTALRANLKLVHLTAEPVSLAEVSLQGFGKPFTQTLPKEPIYYDMQTKYAAPFGIAHYYQYRKIETIQAIRSYAQSEPLLHTAPTGLPA